MDPYEILGVARDATTRSIHAAYRKKAKNCHPDLGGDAKVFDRLKKAHDLLSDRDRRARYDRTGDMTEATADNSVSEVLSFVNIAMQSIVAQYGQTVNKIDLIAAARKLIFDSEQTISVSIRDTQAQMEIWNDLSYRIHLKPAKNPDQRDQENHVAAACRANIAALRDTLMSHQKRIETIRRAVAFLDDYTFNRNVKSPGLQTDWVSMNMYIVDKVR